MDQPPHDKVTGATVAGAADSPSADLLAGWLALALKVPVKRVKSPVKSGPGLHSVILNRRCGDISLIRPQTITAELKVANQPERHVALPRRGLRDCLSEELRRLDADEVYAEVLTKGMALVAKQAAAADTKAPAARGASTAQSASADKATAVKAPAGKQRLAPVRRRTKIAAAAAAVDDPPTITDDGSPTGVPGSTPEPAPAEPGAGTNGEAKPARKPRASTETTKPTPRRRTAAKPAVSAN